MIFRAFVFGFVIIFICSSVSADHDYIEACDAVFSPESATMSCCDPMDNFVEIIKECREESCSDDDDDDDDEDYEDGLKCSTARCVLATYEELSCDNSTLDEHKVRHVMRRLIRKNPEWKPLLDEEKRLCLHGQYKRYASYSKCDLVKYLTCSYGSNLLGCQEFDDSPSFCRKLAKNVAICKAHLHQYLKYKESCD